MVLGEDNATTSEDLEFVPEVVAAGSRWAIRWIVLVMVLLAAAAVAYLQYAGIIHLF